jgi:hypothetical protein
MENKTLAAGLGGMDKPHDTQSLSVRQIRARQGQALRVSSALPGLALVRREPSPDQNQNSFGSERESVKPLILGRILQNHEFGPVGRHVLSLEQQVA